MTAFPVPANLGNWWLTTIKHWSRLHAVSGDCLTWDDLNEAIEDGAPVHRHARCGQDLDLTYPGLMSRYSLPRCAHCCRALGIQAGDGTPCNAASRKRGQ